MRHKLVIVSVIIVLVVVVTPMTVYLYRYETNSNYGGVSRFIENPYYNGKPLPSGGYEDYFNFSNNTTDRIGIQYYLQNFPSYIWSNSSSGSFEIGSGFLFSGLVYAQYAPLNTVLVPRPVISLIHAKINGTGYLGFRVISLTAYNGFPGYDQYNYTSTFDPFPVSLWISSDIVNYSSGIGMEGTFGTVYNINPVIRNITNFPVDSYQPGEYFVDLKIQLFLVLPWGNIALPYIGIVEPWVTVEY